MLYAFLPSSVGTCRLIVFPLIQFIGKFHRDYLIKVKGQTTLNLQPVDYGVAHSESESV